MCTICAMHKAAHILEIDWEMIRLSWPWRIVFRYFFLASGLRIVHQKLPGRDLTCKHLSTYKSALYPRPAEVHDETSIEAMAG